MMWTRWTARGLSLIWAVFWTWFGLDSGIGEGGKPLEVLLHTAVPGLVFLGSALMAWRWEPVGGVLLLLEGLIVLIGYPLLTQHSRMPLSAKIFVELTMALPPLVSGILFLTASRRAAHGQMGLSP